MAIPPLTSPAYPPPRGTATSTQPTQPTHGAAWPGFPQPTGLAQGVEQRSLNLDHPPGYIQNAYAADMNSGQRAAANAEAMQGRNSSPLFSDAEGSEGVWAGAKKLALVTGERLSAAESEFWRRINKQE